MRGRHHIYNFHIGFWGAFLVSLALMMHSAVLLLATAGMTAAQTAPFITLNAPDNGQTFQQSSVLNLSASTSQPVASLRFRIINPGQSINDQRTGTPDGAFQNFTATYNLIATGDYQIIAEATNPQTGSQEQSAVNITVNSGIQLTVTIDTPDSGQVVSAPLEFKAITNAPVDALRFNLAAVQGGVDQDIPATQSQTNTWTNQFDPSGFADGEYNLVAIATLNGQDSPSTPIQITVQNQQVIGTFTMDAPDQGETISGPSYRLEAISSDPATNVSFQITPGVSQTQDLITAQNSLGDGKTFSANLDTTAYPNGSYSVLIFGTINGQVQFSPVVGITINNQATVSPPDITTTALPPAQVGVPYSFTLAATGGAQPLFWTLSAGSQLPAALTLAQSGLIAGVPTQEGTFNLSFVVNAADGQTDQASFGLTVNPAPAPAPLCGDGNVDTGEQCDDGNNVNGDGCSSTCNNETPTQPDTTAPANLTISQPATGAQIQGENSLVIIRGSEAITLPSVLLVNANGQNVLSGSDRAAFSPVNNEGNKVWHYLLDTTPHENGSYSLRIISSTADDGSALNAGPITVTINNPIADDEQPTFTGGTVVRPREGDPVSGIVPLQAQISGSIRSVVFKVQTASNGTKIVNAQFNQSKNLWEATWNSATISAGPVILRTDIVTEDGQQATLPTRRFTLIAETAPVIAPTPTPTNPQPEPRPEEIIPPTVLENISPEGELAQTPIECQVVGITTRAECDEYLKTRAIRVLDEGEQVQVKEQLNQLVTRHIDISDGQAAERDFTQPNQTRRNLDEPLKEILPINTQKARGGTFLVAPSTRPPTNISRFVEQTVDAVLIADRDGDGLPDDAEARYGTDPDNPDTDGDGFTDGQEVKNGFNPAGSGLLATVAAPADIAILNNRPLDQPRFAGVTADETIRVEEVKSTELNEEEAVLNIRGKAEPNSFVTIYIYSSLPVVVTVQANTSGDWEYDFTHPLVDGKHDVYATVTNDTGKIVKKSRPLSFFVQEAKAVNEEDFLNASLTVQDSSSTFLAYYMMGGVLIVLLGGAMFFYYLRAQKGFS